MPYTVSYSGSVLAGFQAAHIRAEQFGLGQEFLRIAAHVHERLQEDPAEFGDPLYFLRHLDLTVYSRMIRPLVARYAVNEARRVVFVTGLAFLPPEEVQ